MRQLWIGAVAVMVAGVALAQGTAAPPAQVAASTAQVAAPTAQVAAPAAKTSSELNDLLVSGRQNLQDAKLVEAAALFEKALKLEPSSQEAMFGLAAADIQLEKYAEALPLLKSLQEQHPDSPMVRNNLAWIYVKSKDPAVRNPELAIKLARGAVLDVPSDYSVWNTLAEAYYANGQYDRALRSAQSALRLSQLAGVTNASSSRELVARCRKAVGASGLDDVTTER